MHRIVPIAIARLDADVTKFASCARNSGARLSVMGLMTTGLVPVIVLAGRLVATLPIARNDAVDPGDAPRFARFARGTVEAILRRRPAVKHVRPTPSRPPHAPLRAHRQVMQPHPRLFRRGDPSDTPSLDAC
jgi:hypothetical protein